MEVMRGGEEFKPTSWKRFFFLGGDRRFKMPLSLLSQASSLSLSLLRFLLLLQPFAMKIKDSLCGLCDKRKASEGAGSS